MYGEVTAGVRRRVGSISTAARAINGCGVRARSTRSRPGCLFMRFLAFSYFVGAGRDGGSSAAIDQDVRRRTRISCRGTLEVEGRLRRPLRRWKTQRHGDRRDADAERPDIEPV